MIVTVELVGLYDRILFADMLWQPCFDRRWSATRDPAAFEHGTNRSRMRGSGLQGIFDGGLEFGGAVEVEQFEHGIGDRADIGAALAPTATVP
ncbi:hypothetical protein [Ensifer sp. SL37]|uniref:hypothetical protein n=1 Tax=Ensifer sp. SL37 TaxID=2995137 RepID=UPI002276F4EC|nr:hypothetical protein [Ensifer sp. SL37]MCY1740530.1 hypothetical protein [Ensifer sp. SL37]